jgi:hypothetical protein
MPGTRPGAIEKECFMPAYWVARSKVNDPVEYKKYTDLVPDIIAKFRHRISHVRAGRRLFHLAGIRQGRGLPAQWCRGGGNNHG